MDIALHWIMVHMFQFAVLGCFTLLYALIVLILVFRLCAPLVREGRKEEGEEGNARLACRDHCVLRSEPKPGH